MAVRIGGPLGRWLAARLIGMRLRGGKPVVKDGLEPDLTDCRQRLERYFGTKEVGRFAGSCVLDYGCGCGGYLVAAAELGARMAIGVDINPKYLGIGRSLAASRNQADGCRFINVAEQPEVLDAWNGRVDCIFTIDAFEHFVRPEEELWRMYDLLVPRGRVLIWFGPPWKHPYGLHMRWLRPLPWMHLRFSESTVMRVRGDYRPDGKTTYAQIHLGQLTVARFTELVRASKFSVEHLRPTPIRGFRPFARLPGLREYFTSVVRCDLIKS